MQQTGSDQRESCKKHSFGISVSAVAEKTSPLRTERILPTRARAQPFMVLSSAKDNSESGSVIEMTNEPGANCCCGRRRTQKRPPSTTPTLALPNISPFSLSSRKWTHSCRPKARLMEALMGSMQAARDNKLRSLSLAFGKEVHMCRVLYTASIQ